MLLSALAFGQGGAFAGSPVINGVGQPIANASVAISTANPCGTSPSYANCSGEPQGIYTGATPPASLATIYTDITIGTATSNPIVTDPLGNWTVYATPGVYWATIYGYQIVPQVQIIVVSAGSSGGGGSVGPGTINQIAKFTPTTTTIGDSSGFDDGTNPVQWPNGLSVRSNAVYKTLTNSATGTTLNLLVQKDSSANAVTASTSSAVVIGIADDGAGVTGPVDIAVLGFHSCVFDNQTAVNDYVIPSTTVAGQCSDAGATKPSNAQIIGTVATINSGASTTAIVDLFTGDTIAPGSTGGSGTVSNCGSNNSNAYYAVVGNVVVCDALFTDDGAGNPTAKSIGLTDSSQAGFAFFSQGASPTLSALNSVYFFAPVAVTTYGLKWPANGATDGCLQGTSDAGSPPTITFSFTGVPCGSGSGVEIQTNGVVNSSQAILNLQNSATTFDGFQVTHANTSGGNVQLGITTPNTQASNPSAPTVTPTGVTGATTDTYLVYGCEDVNCARTSAVSATGTTSTANATLTSSNYNLLTGYADTLFGYRLYVVCRTVAGGTPSSTGIIATGVGKAFKDTGLAGDGSNCASLHATNTTKLDDHCFSSTAPGVNSPPGAPCGIDAPPSSPAKENDEMGEQFGAPADSNDGVYSKPFTFLANSAATWTGGMLQLSSSAGSGVDNVQCIARPVPASTPYTFNELQWMTAKHGNVDGWAGIGFYDSVSGKASTLMCSLSSSNTQNLLMLHWTSATAKTNVFVGGTDSCQAVESMKAQNDGTNLVFSQSTDGVGYTQEQSETIASFMVNQPTHVLLCINNNAVGGSIVTDFDYLRRTQ